MAVTAIGRRPVLIALRSSSIRALLAVLALGVGLRVALLLAYRPAFLGIPDSGTYIDAAHRDLLGDTVHPAGYALFLRVLHWVAGGLIVVPLVQHLLGLATGLILWRIASGGGGGSWRGLLPLTVLSFDGLELYTEHAPLSDPLFAFLTAATLALLVASRSDNVSVLIAVGVLLAAASLVRTVGLVLIPLAVLWLLTGQAATLRRRLWRAAVPAAIGIGLVIGYVAVQDGRSGVFGLTEADGRIAYAIAAPFADCSRFAPPPGTRGLCESSRPSRRGSFNQYLWGVPDHGAHLPVGGRAAVSPAWRLFGPMPEGNARLEAFGRDAILHQPFDYLRQVARNFERYWKSPAGFLRAAATPFPETLRAARDYYGATSVRVDGFGWLRRYARWLELDGAAFVVLLIGSLAPLAAPRSGARSVALLCSGGGWLLLLGSAAVTVDPRYELPALGPLAAGASIGVAEVVGRIRASGRVPGWRT